MTANYVVPFRVTSNRWKVAHRDGDVIAHTRLDATTPDEARAAAEAMFPDRTVIMPDDPKPWDRVRLAVTSTGRVHRSDRADRTACGAEAVSYHTVARSDVANYVTCRKCAT